MATVQLRSRTWVRKGHGGLSKETDYEIYLNNIRLRGFSTHGDMTEGYWGARAHREACSYAADVAEAIGVQVLRVKVKK